MEISGRDQPFGHSWFLANVRLCVRSLQQMIYIFKSHKSLCSFQYSQLQFYSMILWLDEQPNPHKIKKPRMKRVQREHAKPGWTTKVQLLQMFGWSAHISSRSCHTCRIFLFVIRCSHFITFTSSASKKLHVLCGSKPASFVSKKLHVWCH